MGAFASHGTLIKRGDGATPTEAFTTIAMVKDIKGPGRSLGTEEVTNQSSTAAEFVAGVPDSGEVAFDMNYDPADTGHQGLITDMTSRTLRNFKIVFPDTGSAEYAFAAFVTKFETDMKVKGALTASVTLKISGAVTFTA
jgi:predicted secreted protein